MTRVSPTVLNVSRAVAELDEHASGHPDKTIEEMQRRVASNIAYQLNRGGWILGTVDRNDVDAILTSHGASAFTVQQHAADIAGLIRTGDFDE